MIFVPSRGRRQHLEGFFRESRPRLPGRVLIDEDDASYDGMALPAGWEFFRERRAPLVQIMNRAFGRWPDEAVYGCVADDTVCGPEGWDVTLAERAGRSRVAWGEDGINGEKLCAIAFVGGDLVRRMGWLSCPAFGHLYADQVWHAIATATGRAVYRPDIRTIHRKVKDRTYRERSTAGDAARWRAMQGGEIEALIERARSW